MHTLCLKLFTLQPNLVWLTTSPMDRRAPTKLPGKQGPTHPSLYRLMRTLANLGILTEDVTRCFALTPLGEALKTGAPGSARRIELFKNRPESRFLHQAKFKNETSTGRAGDSCAEQLNPRTIRAYLDARRQRPQRPMPGMRIPQLGIAPPTKPKKMSARVSQSRASQSGSGQVRRFKLISVSGLRCSGVYNPRDHPGLIKNFTFKRTDGSMPFHGPARLSLCANLGYFPL